MAFSVAIRGILGLNLIKSVFFEAHSHDGRVVYQQKNHYVFPTC